MSSSAPRASTGPDELQGESRVRFLSLNCWGLKFVSKHRLERLHAIAGRLGSTKSYDIIALQELWVEDDFEVIRTSLFSTLPFYRHFYSGIITGPGLTVFSRWPIESSFLFTFPINGWPSAIHRGDWYVGKGVASCVIVHPSGRKIEVLNSHMHAPYGSGDAAYTCHRTAQAWNIAQLAARAKACGHVTFAVGDFNSKPQSVQYQLFKNVGYLADAWVERHGEFSGDMKSLTPQEQIEQAGVTSNSQLNTWRAHYPLESATRLDYIFYDPSTASVVACQPTFVEPEPGVGSLSDHFGIEGSFDVHEPKDLPATGDSPQDLAKLYDEVLFLITQYRPVSRWQASWRLNSFVLAVLVVIGLLVAVWFAAAHNRAYVGFIFIFVAVLVMVPATVNGLIGLIFGRYESRALSEFEAEVLMCRDNLVNRRL